MRFEQEYFKDSTYSNYQDYTRKKYDTLCKDLMAIGVQKSHRILDFGCATGALLNEFYKNGYRNIKGTDVSFWAISYGRYAFGFSCEELQFLNYSLLEDGADWIICLDVLEHIDAEELYRVLDIIRCGRMVVRVPVSIIEGEPYALEVSRNDKTHIQCHTKKWWENILSNHAYLESIVKGKAIYDSEGVFAGVFKWLRQ